MPIRVVCRCGKAYSAPAERAGKAFRCPACGEEVVVPAVPPQVADVFSAIDLDRPVSAAPLPPPPTPTPAPAPVPRPAAASPPAPAPAPPSSAGDNGWRYLLMVAFFLSIPAFLAGQGGESRTQTFAICLAIMLSGLACSHPRR